MSSSLKPLKSVAHNVCHSFASTLNYWGGDYGINHLARSVIEAGNLVTVDLLTGASSPALSGEGAHGPGQLAQTLPQLLAKEGFAADLLVSATATYRFRGPLPKPGGNVAYDCKVEFRTAGGSFLRCRTFRAQRGVVAFQQSIKPDPLLGSDWFRSQGSMTIRDYLTRRKGWLGSWSIASFVILVAALIAGEVLESPPLHILALASLVSYLVSVIFYQYRVRCPRCGGNIGRHTSYFGLRRALFFDTINYCPFCGVQLDESVIQAHGALFADRSDSDAGTREQTS